MSVLDVLDRRVVDLNMKVKDKDDAIRHLSCLLKEAGYIEDIEEFVKDIYERENEGITGIGEHIAIPHGKSESVRSIGIAIGKLENMIEWESLDNKPVDLIFLFAVSKNQYDSRHLKLLGDLAGRLGRNNTIKKLREMNDFEDLLEAFGEETLSVVEDMEVLSDEIEIKFE
ncbi:MAG: fructose PTS transporter subunit IIA [Clostridiaceae bacterium]